jgi:nicotinamidase-related amidase
VDVSGAGAPAAVLETTLPRLRAAGVPVVWLNWGNRPDRANLPPGVRHVYDPDGRSTGIGDPLPNGSRVLELGSWSAAVVDGLTVEPQDLHVAKYRMSGVLGHAAGLGAEEPAGGHCCSPGSTSTSSCSPR